MSTAREEGKEGGEAGNEPAAEGSARAGDADGAAASLARIDRLKGWLDAFRPLPPAVVEELSHRYEVRLTYHSTAIEGNTLTQSETALVLEKGITVGGKTLAEHLEVIGHRDAMGFVDELARERTPVGEREIREVHALVLRGADRGDAGAYRTLDVMAAGTEYRYPSHLRIAELMRDFASWLAAPSDLHPVRRATEAHLRFVTIHPFRDGNGRVGRLLMNLLLLRAGYPITVLRVEDRAAYLDALVAAQGAGTLAPLHALVEAAVEASLLDTLRTVASAADAHADEKPFAADLRAVLVE